MPVSLKAAAAVMGAAVLSCLEPVCADDCATVFTAARTRYHATPVEYTLITSDVTGHEPYLMLHQTRNGHSYTFWEYLNGPVRGFTTRDGTGFDFNREQKTVEPLTWHPTKIFDRLFSPDLNIRDYTCVMAGRIRLMGNRASLLRLIPKEGLRYGFVLALNDETQLPLELSVLDPVTNTPVSKISTLQIRELPNMEFPIADQAYDRFAKPAPASSGSQRIWNELNIPNPFSLIGGGDYPQGGEGCAYQDFSDGLTVFRVYRNQKSSVRYPAVNNGSLTVFRKQNNRFEYAVVGEVPLKLAERVLVGIN